MERSHSIGQQISSNFADMLNALECSKERLWLTFYIAGDPPSLGRLADELAIEGWVNAVDWQYGVFYPKVEASKSLTALIEVSLRAQTLCEQHGAAILGIDADTSPDVERSSFIELYNSPS